jgi:hypothetical protein
MDVSLESVPRKGLLSEVSSLPSVQRSYTSEWLVGWLVTKERKEGNPEFAGYQGCSGYDGCGIVVIYSVSELLSELLS